VQEENPAQRPEDLALEAEIEQVRADEDFTARAKRLLERDREIINHLAQ
jgi:hypothetical protein